MRIRDARDDDLADITRVAGESDLLVGELSGENFPMMLTWLYVDSPPNIRLQFVAEHDERVVAHYGAAPILYKLFGETCVAGFASNLVIDREHRAGMLFMSLQSHLQRESSRRGFCFVYGLITRPNVLEPHLRMGWKRIGKVPVYAKPFNFVAVSTPFIANRWLRGLAHAPLRCAEVVWRLRWLPRPSNVLVTEAASFEADSEPFLATFTAGREITAVRSCEILNWRFASYPERGYRIFIAREDGRVVGYVVTRCMTLKHLRALVLVDIAFDPARPEVGTALLRCCDQEAMRLRIDVVATISNPSSPFIRHLRKFGFLKTPESFTLVVHGPKDSKAPGLTEAQFSDWHVTWFDHDYV